MLLGNGLWESIISHENSQLSVISSSQATDPSIKSIPSSSIIKRFLIQTNKEYLVMAITQQTAKTEYTANQDGTKYGYRRFGATTGVPLLFLMHFRGTMDAWDPLLINPIAAHRPIILFDNAGVGKSTGTVSTTVKEMAAHVLNFLSLINVKEVDILGFSLGGFIAPMAYLNGPKGLVRKLILAGTGPSAGEEAQANTDDENAYAFGAATQLELTYDNCFAKIFFYDSPTSYDAGQKWWERIHERGPATSGEERSDFVSEHGLDGGAGMQAQGTALGNFSNIENRADGSYDRLGEITAPTFVAQGKKDAFIRTFNSFLLQQKMPDARLKIFPDSGHGFLFQFAEEFAEDVVRFLDEQE
jgi:pimeloyl-ACP methyl ester carboxylesterase